MKTIRLPGRNVLLIFLFSGVVLVLGNSMIGHPQVSRLTPPTFNFPPQVPLPTWQLQYSKALPPDAGDSSQAQSGKQYHYQRPGMLLTVETYYFPGNNSYQGDVKRFVQTQTNLPYDVIQPANITYRPEVGFYSAFTHADTVYLTSCMNPDGRSTVSQKQFLDNRATASLQPHRLMLWMLGRVPLRDERCLWVLMAAPLKDADQQTTKVALEAAWFDWFQWWKTRFPLSH